MDQVKEMLPLASQVMPMVNEELKISHLASLPSQVTVPPLEVKSVVSVEETTTGSGEAASVPKIIEPNIIRHKKP